MQVKHRKASRKCQGQCYYTFQHILSWQGSGSQLPVYVLKDSIENIRAAFTSPTPFFFSFLFFPSGRRNETRCYKTKGKIPGKSCFQLILYILLAQFMSFSSSPLRLHCLHLQTVPSKGSGSWEVSSGFPGPDWGRFRVHGERLPFL